MKPCRTVLFLIQPLVLILLAGCALMQTKSPEETLQARVSQYMQARIDDQWDTVYGFFDPAYRKEVSKEAFLAVPARVDFLQYSIDAIEIAPSENEATVKLKVDVSVQGFEFKGTPEKQQWIREGSAWYIKQKVRKQGNPFETER